MDSWVSLCPPSEITELEPRQQLVFVPSLQASLQMLLLNL